MKLEVQKIAQLTGHNSSIFALSADEETQYFLSGAGDGWIVRWDLHNPEMGKLLAKVETQIFSLLFIPTINTVLAGNMNGGIHWVNLQDSNLNKNIAHHSKGVFGFCQVENYIFSIGGDGILTKWSFDPIQSLESYQLSNQSLRSITYSPKRNELAVGASDHSIYFLDVTTLELKQTIENAHKNSVFCLSYHPKHPYLLSGGRDAMLKVWDLDSEHQLLNEQAAHLFTINSIAFHPQGHLFATGSRDKTVKIWDAHTFKLLKVLETVRDKGHLNSVNILHWSALKNYLISGSDDRSMIIWKID